MDRRGTLAEILMLGLPAYTYFYTVGSVGFWLPLYAKELGWSYTIITLLATVYFLAITPSNILSGILADATGKPSTILAMGMTLNAAATAAMPYTREPGLLMALRVIQGLGLATSLPMALGSLSLAHGITRGVGVTVVMQGLGMATGSLAGGILVERLGYEGLFHSAALLSLLSAMLALRWRIEKPPQGAGVLRGLRRLPLPVIVVASALAARNIFASGVFSILTIFFNMRIGLSLATTGVALALNPIMQMIAGLTAPRLVTGREVLAYSTGLASTSVVFAIYLYSTGPMEVYAAQALLGLLFGVASVAGNIYIISRSPSELRYTASSLFSFAFNLGWILGTTVAGPVMDAYGPEAWIKASIPGTLIAGASALAALKLEDRG
ncbi:MAG: MFS transporter [Desulfurococcales archaeon]|nr:MFS transporter [Desulfurococcales archaeon]MCE4605547.1 MFS transporter [Desulfurococcales archaeon]